MVCKKCGCEVMLKNGEWYTCPLCGAVVFDTSPEGESPTKAIDKIESSIAEKAGSAQNGRNTQNGKTAEKSRNRNTDNEKAKKSRLRETTEFLMPIVIALVIAIILKSFVFANAKVPTGSMLNTIHEKDRIIASRLAYINKDPERYDIVIFRYPDNEKEIFVKRIIGLPGERIYIKDGIVYAKTVDNEVIQLDDSFVTNCVPYGDFGEYTVPEDCYFMMGDNRNGSWDSRYWTNKYVHKDKILGKVKFRYYPSYEKLQ